jgi:hypothetical protein
VDTPSEFISAVPEPVQILGLKLLPLSLGRYRFLRRLGCKFVSEAETNADIGDLLMGVAICSMRYEDASQSFENGQYFRFIRTWSKRIGAKPPWYLRGKWGRIVSATFIGKRWRKNHSFNFVEKMQLFKNYIAASQELPTYVPLHSSENTSTSHWSTAVEITLRHELNWTTKDINEQPLSKALSDCFRHMEQQGMVRIFSDQDLEEGRKNAAVFEAMAKGGNRGS